MENGCGKDATTVLAHYMVEQVELHAWPMSADDLILAALIRIRMLVKNSGVNDLRSKVGGPTEVLPEFY